MTHLPLKTLLALTLIAAAAQASATITYYMVAPMPSARIATPPVQPPAQSITLSLSSFTPTPGAEGTPYSFSLRGVTQLAGGSLDDVIYSLAGGSLPAGLNLTSGGQISGTPAGPTPPEGLLVTVQASYGGKTAQQSYLLNMEALSISLAAATLPDAMEGQPYSFDFKSLTQVKGGTGIGGAKFAKTAGTIPGINLVLSEGGLLTGTPAAGSTNTSGTFTVTGSYLGKSGEQVYTIKVERMMLEAAQIALGATHTCVITSEGGVKCWGDGAYGQLGNGTTLGSSEPVDVVGLNAGVRQIAASPYHTCAITNAGGVKCWGRNENGELGDGTGLQSTVPVDVVGLTSGVKRISASGYVRSNIAHTCAITISGAAKCWGSNNSGRLGIGEYSFNEYKPVDVRGLDSGVTAISAGAAHTCAIHNGSAKCWGASGNGRLGNGTPVIQYSPAPVSNLNSDIVEISAGGGHSCARTSAGVAWCWGWNASGELGDGTKTDRTKPVEVSGLGSGTYSIQAGYSYTCALSVSGGVQCWGLNSSGRLGDGTTTMRLTPVSVQGLTADVRSIVVNAANYSSAAHTCAMRNDGKMLCWGANGFGQLGDGTTTNSSAPVEVRKSTIE